MNACDSATANRASVQRKPVPIAKWLWRSYVRAAIVPLLVVEVSFLVIYWLGSNVIYSENVEAVGEISTEYLSDLSKREALNIEARLSGITALTTLFAAETRRALDGDEPLTQAQRARLATFPQGGLYTRSDNGTTASFYSAINTIGEVHYAKIGRLSVLDGFMSNAKASETLIASLYFNSWDSYNLIYPYIDAREMVEPRTDVRTYNFYYEADAAHNPSRSAVWTDAYVDPAGHGWLVSSLAPVWRGNKLEGVVGIDIQLETIVERLLALELPWNGYALLVGKDGHIIAMPPQAELDLNLKELKSHAYNGTVKTSTFKPDSFNIAKRSDTRALSIAMQQSAEGTINLDLNGPRLASFADIAGTHWKLVIVVPKSRVYADADHLNERLRLVGYVMLAGLLAFYAAFFAYLYFQAKRMSKIVAAPLEQIEQVLSRIRDGDYQQTFAGSKVAELETLGRHLVATGAQLGAARDQIVAQERLVAQALEQQRRINAEQTKFVRVMSHELRTPLAVIDSAAQIIERKADACTPEDLKRRAGKMRSATKRIALTLENLLSGTQKYQNCDLGEMENQSGHGSALTSEAQS